MQPELEGVRVMAAQESGCQAARVGNDHAWSSSITLTTKSRGEMCSDSGSQKTGLGSQQLESFLFPLMNILLIIIS